MLGLTPIGIIRTDHRTAMGTPIQPSAAGGTTGQVVIADAWAEGLADLEGFGRIWLLFWMHRTVAARTHVIPYRDHRERGIFATRMPPRPNPLGLSPVRLLRIEGNVIHVAEIDILDGSPLLDIKPYVPEYDSWPGVPCGWLDDPGVDREHRRADLRYQQDGPPAGHPRTHLRP